MFSKTTTTTEKVGPMTSRSAMMALVALTLVAMSAGAEIAPTEGELEPLPTPLEPQVNLTVGELAYGGKSCAFDEEVSKVILDGQTIAINLATIVSKEAGSGLARGACTWALPTQVPAGYKLKIAKIDTYGMMAIAKGAQITGNLEVFTTGDDESASIEFNGKSAKYNKLVRQEFSQEADIETECGAGINLRSNASFIIRNGERESHALFGGLLLHYSLVKCD